MEKPLLGLLLAAHELHVVNQQHLHAAVALAELLGGAVADGRNEVVGKLLRRDVQDALATAGGLLADGVEEVGLAQAHAGIQEQGIVGLARGVGHRLGGAEGHAIGVAHHEAVERILAVEVDPAGHGRRRGRRSRGGGDRRCSISVTVHRRGLDILAGHFAGDLKTDVQQFS